MRNSQATYQKTRSVKYCLLALALLGAIFTFSGYFAGATSFRQEAARTEVVSFGSQVYKPTVSYKAAIAHCYRISAPANYLQHLLSQVILHYSSLAKTRFDNSVWQAFSIDLNTCFEQLKTIPQSSDEDFLIYQRG